VLFIKRLGVITANPKSCPLSIINFIVEFWGKEQCLVLRNLKQHVQTASKRCSESWLKSEPPLVTAEIWWSFPVCF